MHKTKSTFEHIKISGGLLQLQHHCNVRITPQSCPRTQDQSKA